MISRRRPTTVIFRSVGVGGTNELASYGTVGDLTVRRFRQPSFSGTTMPNRVGVGDAIVYDSDNDNDIDCRR